jgi:threonine aldolase
MLHNHAAESAGEPERQFASDNYAGAHPDVLAAIAAANHGHVAAYGDDPFTGAAESAFRRLLGEESHVFFVFNGTGANVIALASALRPYQAVICAESAHVNVDECGAFERFAGSKLIAVASADGKLTPDDIVKNVKEQGNVHHVQAGAVSISQSTELGTVYTVDELAALGAVAREHDLVFHVDGARLANAAVSLDVDLRTMLGATGVDVCTFGGTKNGLLFGEAIVFPKYHAALESLPFIRKQGMQLASKMRFVAVQFEALLRDDLWRRSAAHANAMAHRLAARLRGVDGVRIVYPVQANGVFAAIPPHSVEALQRERRFYVWDEAASIVRWMAAFDTTESDVDEFAAAIVRAAGVGAAAAAVSSGAAAAAVPSGAAAAAVPSGAGGDAR